MLEDNNDYEHQQDLASSLATRDSRGNTVTAYHAMHQSLYGRYEWENPNDDPR